MLQWQEDSRRAFGQKEICLNWKNDSAEKMKKTAEKCRIALTLHPFRVINVVPKNKAQKERRKSHMKIKTNAENRKDVVKAAAEILNTPSKYLGVPSCNFQVGNCIIDRAGTVETEDEKQRRCSWQDWWRGDS